MPKNVVVEIGVDERGANSHVSGPSPTSPSREVGANGRLEDPVGVLHEKIGSFMSHLTAKDVMNIPRAGSPAKNIQYFVARMILIIAIAPWAEQGIARWVLAYAVRVVRAVRSVCGTRRPFQAGDPRVTLTSASSRPTTSATLFLHPSGRSATVAAPVS